MLQGKSVIYHGLLTHATRQNASSLVINTILIKNLQILFLIYFLFSAEIFLKSVNDSIEPCDDFFKYACGKIEFHDRYNRLNYRKDYLFNTQYRVLVKAYEGN